MTCLQPVKVKVQFKFFFQNIAVLNEAHNQGLLVLPMELRELARKYNLERLRFQSPSPQDRIDEASEFRAYVEALLEQNCGSRIVG